MKERSIYFIVMLIILFLIGSFGNSVVQEKLIPLVMIVIILLIIGHAIEDQKKFDLNQLARVEVRELYVKTENGFVITEEKDFDVIREAFEKFEWEPNTKMDIQGERTVEATFFYTYEENMPEPLSMCKVYLMKEGSISFQSEKEEEGYGELSKEHAERLTFLFF
ncbi:hypothetical protein RRU94_07355 [Domibacillus sp. DTU_2020_1001157_1_SI_ALB_TIR_016]|uniref:hypothetical protein n=1 Tax=Domibacillus sp. DTU_2020_1001157_1_SI_ALB_TIR_016 TaxID=3077789 RepID=UPI0028EB1D1C|nr:hypothetical protein [Domibacillus sp. DTU_2020_1001157_1_SI_ALB_TIR_016]WNS78269.1 hypothetical protein RRU94_07355 [Domibacillus sp. DTU_2020_1001157_1_SI_ALB_TIR_016]